MPLHLIKLSVGVESVQDLAERQERYAAIRLAAGLSPNPVHETRMYPKRAAELLDGGSIYWVIKHKICVRQLIINIERVEQEGAPKFCIIHFDSELVPVRLKQKRPFQGWRYLKDSDAPPDVNPSAKSLGSTPQHLELALKDACVW